MKRLIVVLIGCFVFSSLAYSKDIFDIAKNGTPDEIESAVKAGADVNARDKHGLTPLMMAAETNTNPDVITVLVNSGADVNARDKYGRTPLMEAALGNKNPDVITMLLNSGADVNARDNGDFTPLMCAAILNTNPEVISVLLKSGADPKVVSIEGKTAWDYIQNNKYLKNTKAYWELNEAQYK